MAALQSGLPMNASYAARTDRADCPSDGHDVALRKLNTQSDEADHVAGAFRAHLTGVSSESSASAARSPAAGCAIAPGTYSAARSRPPSSARCATRSWCP